MATSDYDPVLDRWESPSMRCEVCGQLDAVNNPCACDIQRRWTAPEEAEDDGG